MHKFNLWEPTKLHLENCSPLGQLIIFRSHPSVAKGIKHLLSILSLFILHVRSYYPNRNFINWGKRRYKSTWYALIESPSFVSIKKSIHPFFHSPLQMLLLTVDTHKNMKLTPFCQSVMWEKQPKPVWTLADFQLSIAASLQQSVFMKIKILVLQGSLNAFFPYVSLLIDLY